MANKSQRGRSLGAVLRDARDRAGLSAREVGRQLEVSHTTIGRWESGDTPPSSEEVAAYLAVIGVTGTERDRILTLARTGDESDWVMSGPPGITAQLASVMDNERTATRITEWAPLSLPGLLQTSDYARTIINDGAPDASPSELETLLMVRLARRDALTRRIPIEFEALIGKPAILGGIGGPEIMADQLQRLARNDRDNVTIRVVDLGGLYHVGHAGAFILYEFDELPPVVYLEHYRSGTFLVDKDDVAAYQTAVEILRREAMSPDASAGLIADVIPNISMETTT